MTRQLAYARERGGKMLTIDPNGMVVHGDVRAARQLSIERGDMPTVNGIIVHQTGGSERRIGSVELHKSKGKWCPFSD
jgi:hypothetical protein